MTGNGGGWMTASDLMSLLSWRRMIHWRYWRCRAAAAVLDAEDSLAVLAVVAKIFLVAAVEDLLTVSAASVAENSLVTRLNRIWRHY